MRGFVFVVVALSALICCGSAWAVVDTTVTITDKGGKPIPGGSITLTRVDKKPAPHLKSRKTDSSGKLTVTHDEKDKDDNAPIIVTIRKGGATLIARTTLHDLLTTGTIVVEEQPATTSEPTSEPARTAVSRPKVAPESVVAQSPWSVAIIAGAEWTHYSTTFSSTGTQGAAGSFGATGTGAEICGQGKYNVWSSGPYAVMLGMNLCGNTSGTITLFHFNAQSEGQSSVTATVKPDVAVEPFGEVRFGGPGDSVWLWSDVGVIWEHRNLTITSSQTGSSSQSDWVPGVDFRAGLSTTLCMNCVFGNPLYGSIGGNVAWFTGSQSVKVQSAQPEGEIPLIQTATINHSTEYGVQAKLTAQISDLRLKRDVVKVGQLENGLGLYRYRYLWSDQRYVGVMAQEVALISPDAVVHGADGFLRVDYERLGLQLQTWEAWNATHHSKTEAQSPADFTTASLR